MIILDGVADTLGLITGTDSSTDYFVAFADIDFESLTAGNSDGNIASVTTTSIVAAPAASTQRQIKYASIRNRSGTASQVVTVLFNGGTSRYLTPDITLGPGEALQYTQEGGWFVLDKNGRNKVQNVDVVGYNGLLFDWFKVGATSEAGGVIYGFAKDAGYPGAWVPGSPGVNGWWTNAATATNAANPAGATECGCPKLIDPATGNYYLRQPTVASSVVHYYQLLDLLWYNTGLNVTTTTEQAISQPGSSKPARDLNGSTDGEGWQAAIYVTTATTNGAAVTNTTLNYTNSEGTGSRTGTIASFPQTCVAGAFVPFQLQAGDRGIRSIEGITLGTSYGGGAISLLMYRPLIAVPVTVANVGGIGHNLASDPTGIRIYDGTALWWVCRTSATTATSMQATVPIVER